MKQVKFVCEDLRSLSAPKAHFNGAYARLVFAHMEKPQILLENIAQALKPNATLVVSDFISYHRSFAVAPPHRVFDELNKRLDDDQTKRGGSLCIQQHMPKLLSQLGFRITEVRPMVRAAKRGGMEWHWYEEFLRLHLRNYVARNVVSEALVDEFWDIWGKHTDSPNAFLVMPTILDIIAKKD